MTPLLRTNGISVKFGGLVAVNAVDIAVPADVRLNFCDPCEKPPTTQESPKTRRRLPMMLPVIDALTTAVWCARSAVMAMISSAAFPNVAFRKPPRVGPARSAG